MCELKDRIKELEAEVDRWKSNHDNQVDKNKILTERPDLPVQRVSEHKHVLEVESENKKLKEIIKTLSDGGTVENLDDYLENKVKYLPAHEDRIAGTTLITFVERCMDSNYIMHLDPDIESHRVLIFANMAARKLLCLDEKEE